MNKNPLSLKSTLLISFLCAGILPLFVSGFIISSQAIEAIENASFNQLESVREVKRREIEKYFISINSQVETLSQSTMTIEAIQEFKSAFHNSNYVDSLDENTKQEHLNTLTDYYQNHFAKEYKNQNSNTVDISSILPKDPIEQFRQFRYIANNKHPLGSKDALNSAEDVGENYDKAHEKYHPIFRNYLQKFGYYDIFLVDANTGHIVYSVFKEMDYATSLTTGPYNKTNFARSFRKVVEASQPNSIVLEDFEPYLPSYEAAASFTAAPIYSEGQLEGVLIFQMPVGRINSIMQNVVGLGETGETYLVAEDKLMRSQSRFVEENTISKQKIDSETLTMALNGESGGKIIKDYRGIEALSSFAPLEIAGLNWAIIAEIDKDEAFIAEKNLLITLFTTIILSIIAVIALTIYVVKSIQKSLGGDPREIQSIAESIAKNDLERQLKPVSQSSGVYASMVTMRDNIRSSIERDAAISAENSRIKQALDNVSANVMVADDKNEIIYLNDAALSLFKSAEKDIKNDLPTFSADKLIGANIDQFHKKPEHQQNLLKSLKSTHKAEFIVGGHTMSFVANPVIGEEDIRLGTVVEWRDRTKEVSIQSDIEKLVNSAQLGELNNRLDTTDKEGFFLDLSTSMNSLVETLAGVFDDVAQIIVGLSQGNLDQEMSGEYSGTFADVQKNINQTINKLNEIVGGISSSANQVKSGSTEISSGNQNLSTRTEQQAASLEETSSTLEELTSTVRDNANSAQQAHQLSNTAREIAQDGGKVTNNAIIAMEEISESSSKISDIIGVIDEIAFQTNLLALNASVEAARAGDQGRGFAVVATEVRNLAQRSATSAKEIKDLIQDSASKVESGSFLVNESGETLEKIVASVIKVSDIIAGISTSSQEQAKGIDQVNSAIINLDSLTQQNSALAEQTSAASESVNQLANDMNQLVTFFKTKN
ncbi:MAG: PAS domain-containing protein [Gammaproteobacteria bacterium]|nr:PAS domain-containing protein [Gammaproteobacteria bacterium]